MRVGYEDYCGVGAVYPKAEVAAVVAAVERDLRQEFDKKDGKYVGFDLFVEFVFNYWNHIINYLMTLYQNLSWHGRLCKACLRALGYLYRGEPLRWQPATFLETKS